MNAISSAAVVEVPIANVIIGERRREKPARLQRLAKSIHDHGLIHPILLRGHTLIAGHRRLEACRSLKWTMIPARQVKRLSDDELRTIELDENTARENLSDFATSKARLIEIRQAEADLKAKPQALVSVGVPHRNSKRGRKEGQPKGRTAGSKRDVAEATGIDPKTQGEIQRHVALAEQYPLLQGRGWRRHHVLDAGKVLDKIPSEDRAPLTALLTMSTISPAMAIQYLKKAAKMPTVGRDDIVTRPIDR